MLEAGPDGDTANQMMTTTTGTTTTTTRTEG
jgi:hypothetical protein